MAALAQSNPQFNIGAGHQGCLLANLTAWILFQNLASLLQFYQRAKLASTMNAAAMGIKQNMPL